MKVVGIRELKNRLSEYLRIVRSGETVLVTDRGEVVAEIRVPGSAPDDPNMSAGLMDLVRRGTVSLGAPNRADVYTSLPPLLPEGTAAKLLDEERGER